MEFSMVKTEIYNQNLNLKMIFLMSFIAKGRLKNNPFRPYGKSVVIGNASWPGLWIKRIADLYEWSVKKRLTGNCD